MTAPATERRLRPATRGDWPAIEQLLRARGLPTAGAQAHLEGFLVAQEGTTVAGCAGIEQYGDAGLLRSVAVAEGRAGQGLGSALVTASVELARHRGLRALFLLTTTAAGYFPRFGFQAVSRDALPAALALSEELKGACPASAAAMRLGLEATERRVPTTGEGLCRADESGPA